MSEHLIALGAQEEHADVVELIHDLRNKLAPILMQAQLLSQYAERAGSHAEAIKKSAAAIERSVKEIEVLLRRE
jgi:signal transduction histidine kinase